MSVEILTREERGALVYLSKSAAGQVPWDDIARYEATLVFLEKALNLYGRHKENADTSDGCGLCVVLEQLDGVA